MIEDLDRLDLLHAEEWLTDIFAAYPRLAAEIRALRARVEVLERGAAALRLADNACAHLDRCDCVDNAMDDLFAALDAAEPAKEAGDG